MAAAEAMLDEKHPNLPTKPTDDNTYILGRIYDHNIVIACLRSGVYGTTSAATLATQMQSTFQSIRFFLMVGIGGGAPSEKVDIRLGDVVVSNPTRDFGGVIQYDYGKTVSGGRFERTGVLNKPLPVLLTAVSRLKAAHLSMPNKIPTLLSEMLARNPMMRKSFTYRGADQDLLFDSEYDHCGSENTCDNCDNTRLVTRPARLTYDPIIHYGLIASGNQVVKHGRTRDKLAREIGILCFEMEAAGLMDDFQCLVIRGICDYSDSHKNKQWQQYAAATAAAYAKELLSVVHTSQVVDTPPSRSDLSYYNGKLPFGGEHATSVTVRRNDDQDYETLLEQISSYDYRKVHRRLSQKRLVGTTQWFLDHPDFQAWFTDKSISTLWCSGKIGSGKTIIATAVVEAALYHYPENRSPTVFFYCENEYHRSLDSSYILSSCIKQLCDFLHTTSRPYPEDVKTEIRKFFGPKPIQPDFEDLKYIFNRLFHSVPDAVYIIDGLDVLSQNHGKALLGLIQSLFCFSRPPQGSRILLLSRDHVPGYINIATFMPGIRQISTSGNIMEDIEAYIEASIIDKTMCRKLTDDTVLVEDIKRTLLTESSGMFLWVHLQLEILWDTCYTDAGIRSALATLPKGLEETYGRCIDRINLQDSYALKVLKWVSFGTRSLHIDELREAVSFDLGDTGWVAEKIPQKDVVIGCCANLIVIDPTDNCVRFAHHSVKQYLDKYQGREVQAKRIRDYPNTEQGDLECGELCVTYLSFSDFSLQLSKQSAERAAIEIPQPALLARPVLRLGLTKPFIPLFRKKNQCISVQFRMIRTMSTPDRTRYKFLDYAVTNWALHTKQIPHTSVVWDKFKALATCFNETWNFHPWVPGGRSKYSHLHGLFGWAVKEPHERLLSIALAAGPVLQRVCDLPLVGERLPALHVASKLGYRGIVEILLDFCNVNVSDEEGYTALHHAADRGHIEICRLLLCAKSVKVDGLSKSLCTPLWLAASNGHREVVSLLVEHQSNIKAKGGSPGQTALSRAAQNGHYGVVELLLEKGANLESKDTDGRTPLSWAVKCRHEAISGRQNMGMRQ
ncbi:hypothetical protein BDV37DRAFT_280595 [Aspergillus pseudonomiae]|uniref:NACHT domain-containing protein n=1 Tax=Aspergillus pseudonomiae TaxID=1506151 RepID=A0A5N7DJN2_9EURO|nr:uncharacterized protein BDV37DRAFT_280595 [Aspergillus pseudonomiae]KAE8406637.1 hypothetical protein BDV37DRAFT_280595 [Aspergillus pseudonomiae]